MDVFRFVKLPLKANDPARRYAVVSVTGERVGELEVIPPKQDSVAVSLICAAALSDAAKEDAVTTTRRFLDELAVGWGVHLVDGPQSELQEQPDGRFLIQLELSTA